MAIWASVIRLRSPYRLAWSLPNGRGVLARWLSRRPTGLLLALLWWHLRHAFAFCPCSSPLMLPPSWQHLWFALAFCGSASGGSSCTCLPSRDRVSCTRMPSHGRVSSPRLASPCGGVSCPFAASPCAPGSSASGLAVVDFSAPLAGSMPAVPLAGAS